jgi:hypothetical protein
MKITITVRVEIIPVENLKSVKEKLHVGYILAIIIHLFVLLCVQQPGNKSTYPPVGKAKHPVAKNPYRFCWTICRQEFKMAKSVQ